MLQYFQWYLPADGSLWKQLRSEAQNLKQMGFDSLWLPPAYKGAKGPKSEGYDAYDLYDMGEFYQKGSVRTKYGTRKEYLEAINAIHEAGMQVIVDIVLNHKAGGDEAEKMQVVKVDSKDRTKVISKPIEIEAKTKFTFPGRNKKYSDFEWDYRCFSGVDHTTDLNEDAIFKILNGHGTSWEKLITDQMGNYDFLMLNDIEFRNKAVRKELIHWAIWYWQQTHFDGVRLDGVKHITPSFFVEWLKKLRQKAGKQIFAVGEFWSQHEPELLDKYIDVTKGVMSLFDAPLHRNFHIASGQGSKYDMRNILKKSLVKSMPDQAVTFVENHDTQPLQSLESSVEPWFKPIAYAIILLRQQGYPCVFYADLYGAQYKDKDKTTSGKEKKIILKKVQEIESMMKVRMHHAFGKQRDYFDDEHCIGWTREGDADHSGCVVLISNDGKGFKKMKIGKRYSGKIFIDVLKKIRQQVNIDEDGKGFFLCGTKSVSVWIEKPAS